MAAGRRESQRHTAAQRRPGRRQLRASQQQPEEGDTALAGRAPRGVERRARADVGCGRAWPRPWARWRHPRRRSGRLDGGRRGPAGGAVLQHSARRGRAGRAGRPGAAAVGQVAAPAAGGGGGQHARGRGAPAAYVSFPCSSRAPHADAALWFRRGDVGEGGGRRGGAGAAAGGAREGGGARSCRLRSSARALLPLAHCPADACRLSRTACLFALSAGSLRDACASNRERSAPKRPLTRCCATRSPAACSGRTRRRRQPWRRTCR